jgi:hypothetical protein
VPFSYIKRISAAMKNNNNIVHYIPKKTGVKERTTTIKFIAYSNVHVLEIHVLFNWEKI